MRGAGKPAFLIYQSPACFTDQLTAACSQPSPEGYFCLDAVAQGYACPDMLPDGQFAHYGFDCSCTCTGLALGGSTFTVTSVTYLPFEPYPPASVARAVSRCVFR